MNKFKFLREAKKKRVQFVPVMARGTETTFQIPIRLFEEVLNLGLQWLDGQRHTFAWPYEMTNEVGERVLYQYKITQVDEMLDGHHIEIYYSVKFPDEQVYHNFNVAHISNWEE